MNRQAAFARLGLSGAEDLATIVRVYGQRLSTLQREAASAQTDDERHNRHATIAELVEAYEVITQSDLDAGTQARGGATLYAANDTFQPIEPGVVLAGRLEIGPLLGQGGMGSVYAARDRLKQEDVAVKVLRADLLSSTTAKERFLSEARVSCSLSHPNIVRVHDVGVSGEHYYLSMERLRGSTLRQRIDVYRREERTFSVAEVNDIAQQLIDALRYAHRSIVHRDLKPENIWLTEDGVVKLMDFGIARALTATHLTQTGVMMGTAYYMAPEQRVAAKSVDWRADQYSLGVVLYELLAGTLPTGAVTPLETIRNDLPKNYGPAVMRAMAGRPQDRFPTLDELWARLSPVPKRRAGLALAMGAVTAAAVAGGAFMLTQQVDVDAPAVVADAEQLTAPAEANAPAGAPALIESPDSPVADEPSSEPLAHNATAGARPEASDDSAGSGPQLREPNPPQPETVGRDQHTATTQVARLDHRREQCSTQCDRDHGECASINRRARQECMRAVAFNSSGGVMTPPPAAAQCAFFGGARCDAALDHAACIARIEERYQACIELTGGNVAQRRQDCEARTRDADKLCLDEFRDCRASC